MFALDEGLSGLPATRDQIATLQQSINSPHVAIPGKPAGPAQAFILGLREAHGFGLYIYLYLADAGDCAIYACDHPLRPDEFSSAESEAVAFVESMGFFMDTLNFRALGAADQQALIDSLPVFRKHPGGAAPAAQGAPTGDGQATLARFFASF